MNSETSRAIKQRTEAKDVFYTPAAVAETHIKSIQALPTDIWLDPFAGKKVYYNAFPTNNKHYTEISEGKDFFSFQTPVDIICSNPPYSCIDKVLQHSISLQPRVISYLLLEGKLTPKRLEFMNKHGYSLTHMYLTKVWKWYGFSVAYTFTKTPTINNTATIQYDRVVHH